MAKLLIIAIGSQLGVATVVAQSPQPATEGPTLAVTLQFIADKINAIGPVSFNKDNILGLYQKEIVSNAHGDVPNCALLFHSVVNYQTDGSTRFSEGDNPMDDQVSLGRIHGFKVYSTIPNFLTGKDLETHQPIFALMFIDISGKEWATKNLGAIIFHDEAIANRVGKAFMHAGELCGSTAPEPF